MAGKPSRSNHKGGDQVFAAWLVHAAEEAGYHTNARGWKRALARAAGISDNAVGRYTLGQAMPTTAHARALAGALDVHVDDVLVQALHKVAADVSKPGGDGGVRELHPVARRVNSLLTSLPDEHPRRRQMERALGDLLELLGDSPNTTTTKG